MLETIGTRLEHARNLSGITARELSRLAGLSGTHARLIEEGARAHPTMETGSALCAVLGISMEWLVRGDGPAPTTEQVRAAVDRARTAAVIPEPHPEPSAPVDEPAEPPPPAPPTLRPPGERLRTLTTIIDGANRRVATTTDELVAASKAGG